MAIDFFGEMNKKKENNNSDDIDALLNNKTEDAVKCFGRPEIEESCEKLNLIMKTLGSSGVFEFPPSDPFYKDFVQMLMSQDLWQSYLDSLKDNDMEENDYDFDRLMALPVEERNMRFGAIMMKSMAFILDVLNNVYNPNTDTEKELYQNIVVLESIIYNIRTVLAMYVNFLSEFDVSDMAKVVESLVSISELLENKNDSDVDNKDQDEEISIKIKRYDLKNITSVLESSIDMMSLSHLFIGMINDNFSAQNSIHSELLDAWRKKNNLQDDEKED